MRKANRMRLRQKCRSLIRFVCNSCPKHVISLQHKAKSIIRISQCHAANRNPNDQFGIIIHVGYKKHNEQYEPIEFIQILHKSHDRFLFIDNEDISKGAYMHEPLWT